MRKTWGRRSGMVGSFLAIDWEVLGDELFAEKGWTRKVAEYDEDGSFELHHAPGG